MRWLRLVLLAATLAGMLCCLPLWLSTRPYPLVPLLPAWLILPQAAGVPLLVLVLISLVVAGWFYRPAIIFFLAVTLYLFGCDQNREQPWFYMYWIMLLLNLLSETTALTACRLALSLVYFWAGMQKINGTFFTTVPAGFVEPAASWGWPTALIAALREAVLLTPFLEMFISIGVWFPKTRWPALIIATMLHGAALLFLGPLGHDANLVIWPWNIAMIALLLVLFGSKERMAFSEIWQELRNSMSSLLVLGLYGLLPMLSFFGLWDAYLSFALYSYNLPKAEVYVNESFVEHLPAPLKNCVYQVKNFNPSLRLPYMFEHSIWAEAEMGVPPLPEPRAYVVMFRYLSAYDPNPNDCRMLVKTGRGEVLFYASGDANPVTLNSN